MTTDKILVFTTGGKFYTLGADRLPGGRGHGEPIRIMVDMENDQDIVSAFVHRPKGKLLVASGAGNGFVVPEADVVANTRKGKQVMNVKMPDEAKLCIPLPAGDDGAVAADHVATVGENRKLLIFPLEQIPEMTRGKGVRLQRYKDGGIADLRVFTLGRGPDLAGRLGPQLHQGQGRPGRMDGRARERRPHGAEGLPAEREIWVRDRLPR